MALTQSEDGELGAALGPVASSERISTLDSLRGIAVLGILLLNITGFGLPHANHDPTVYGGAEGANLSVWAINNVFFEGTMRGLFSLLFGAGVILLTSRIESRGGGVEVADIYYRRTLWLLIFGLVHSWILLWHGEILYWYGAVGLILFPLRKLKPKALIILGVLALSTQIPRTLLNVNEAVDAQLEAQAAQLIIDRGGESDEDQADAIERWEEVFEGAKPTDETLQEEIDERRGGYFSVLRSIIPTIQRLQSEIFYRDAFFGIIGTMLIGMALFKIGVLTGERSNRFYLLMMLCGYVIGVTINLYETLTLIRSDFDVIAIKRWGFLGLFYESARIPLSLGHLAAIVLICKQGWLSRIMARFAAVGRMALTNYVMHSVICAFVFYGVGFSLFGRLERYELYYVVFAIWILQLWLSPMWSRRYLFGPLEWLWRSLTYWKRQPFRRPQSSTEFEAQSV